MTTIIEQLEAKLIELQKQIKELKELKPYKRRRAEVGRNYFSLDITWEVIQFTERNDKYDNYYYNSWNYYKTEEEVEKVRDRQLAIVRVNDKIREFNWDWEDNKGEKYYIYNYRWQYKINSFTDRYIWLEILCCKTSVIAAKIISEMKEDLDLILNLR